MTQPKQNMWQVFAEVALSLKQSLALIKASNESLQVVLNVAQKANTQAMADIQAFLTEARAAIKAANEHLAKASAVLAEPRQDIRPDIQAEIDKATRLPDE